MKNVDVTLGFLFCIISKRLNGLIRLKEILMSHSKRQAMGVLRFTREMILIVHFNIESPKSEFIR